MGQAEALWNEHGVGVMTLVERWNYHNELSAQFPISPIRVVYAKVGTLPAASVVEDKNGGSGPTRRFISGNYFRQ
jgi:hypothetical protein